MEMHQVIDTKNICSAASALNIPAEYLLQLLNDSSGGGKAVPSSETTSEVQGQVSSDSQSANSQLPTLLPFEDAYGEPPTANTEASEAFAIWQSTVTCSPPANRIFGNQRGKLSVHSSKVDSEIPASSKSPIPIFPRQTKGVAQGRPLLSAQPNSASAQSHWTDVAQLVSTKGPCSRTWTLPRYVSIYSSILHPPRPKLTLDGTT